MGELEGDRTEFYGRAWCRSLPCRFVIQTRNTYDTRTQRTLPPPPHLAQLVANSSVVFPRKNMLQSETPLRPSIWQLSHVKRLGEFRRFPQLAGTATGKFDVAVIGTSLPRHHPDPRPNRLCLCTQVRACLA
jgi:hypothetical protein